ncbi:hypothetical protein [Rhodoblastus sp.]|uniref:hypothetical protein n=1 Tax=Rhodoblastus sp. TaxID=1962975 RepID=UPI0025DA795B|nr:hypothetical protein [Rhodoblastus sp.]
MLNSDEQRELLKRFIGEQTAHLDRVAIDATSKPLVDEEGRRFDAIAEHEQTERRLSAVFDILAIGGAEARVQERDRTQSARIMNILRAFWPKWGSRPRPTQLNMPAGSGCGRNPSCWRKQIAVMDCDRPTSRSFMRQSWTRKHKSVDCH